MDVVARHQRERWKPPCTPAIEGLQEISKRTAGFMWMSEIILNVRMLRVQIPGRLVDIVSTFRNRKRNNPGLGGCHLFNHLLRIVRREQKIHNRANDSSFVAVQTPLHECVKAIL